MRILNVVTGLLRKITTACSQSKVVNALCVGSFRGLMLRCIGAANSALITAMKATRLEGCSATTAISQWGTLRLQKSLSLRQNISDFTLDRIVEIFESGKEEVFDIQVDRTENFIANGLVSHNTRWHDEDPAGKLETEMNELVQEAQLELLENIEYDMTPEEAERVYVDKLEEIDHWEIVSYPAVAEEGDEWLNEDFTVSALPLSDGAKLLRKKGEALHPARYNEKRLRRIYNSYRKSGQMRYWHALYQQKPVPDEGVFFTRSMLRTKDMNRLSEIRGKFPIITAWDLAVGVKQENDYSVKATGYIDYEGSLNVVDVLRGRWESDDLAKLIVSEYSKERPDQLGIEKGPTEVAVMPLVRKEVKKYNAKLPKDHKKIAPAFREGKEALVPITDKRIRARPLQGMMQGGTMYFLREASWFEIVKFELLRFDRGKFDDIVDALAWLARIALSTHTPVPKRQKAMKSWRDKLSTYIRDGNLRSYMAA